MASGIRSRWASSEASNVGSRLQKWRESLGLKTRGAMAVILDRPEGTYPLSTYRNHEMGISEPSGDQLRRLAHAGCDIAWLITGEGEPRQGRFSSQIPTSDDEGTVSIPHYAVHLSAGNGRSAAEFDELERLVLPADWVRRVFGRPPDHLVLASAAGTSMEPTIRDRDLLVVDTADQRLISGRIYALVVGDSLLVKRIERTLRGQIFLRPDNPAYQTEELTEDLADTVRILGQVIWHGGSLE